jgi:hypothetical protein
MKVAPDLSGVTALDTWLRAADTDHAATPRDPAEDLLVLDVSATGGSSADQLAAGASAQDWADHIFSPLR